MKKISFVLFMVLSFTIYSKDIVNVGIYIINMGEFSIVTGNFNVDFYLTLSSEKRPEFPLDTFEIINAKNISIEKIQETENMKQYRIRGTLNSPVDLKKFPFDKQKLQILIENKVYTLDKVQYVSDGPETSLDKLVSFSGWKIVGWNAEVFEHFYSAFEEKYSSYKLSVYIAKITWNAFFKTFIPVFITMLIVSVSYMMSVPAKLMDRFFTSLIALIATVMFHISISNQIPPVSYLTVADRFMILTYFLLLGTFIFNLIMLKFVEKGKQPVAEYLHKITGSRMIIYFPIVYVAFFVIAI